MKKGLLTVVLSVLFSVLAAYGVVKAATVNDGDNVTSTELNIEKNGKNAARNAENPSPRPYKLSIIVGVQVPIPPPIA